RSSTCFCMHSREEISPACQAVSTTRHNGSANRSSSRSVGSSGAMVPSKSTSTCHLARDIDNSRLLIGLASCVEMKVYAGSRYTCRAVACYAADRFAHMRFTHTHSAHEDWQSATMRMPCH